MKRRSPRFHAIDIAERFFCESEQAEILRAESATRPRTFFQFWTAKEAVMKATSLGVSLEPSRVEVGLNPLRLLAIKGAEELPNANWHLTPLSLRNGYAGALAVTMEPSALVFHDFRSPEIVERQF